MTLTESFVQAAPALAIAAAFALLVVANALVRALGRAVDPPFLVGAALVLGGGTGIAFCENRAEPPEPSSQMNDANSSPARRALFQEQYQLRVDQWERERSRPCLDPRLTTPFVLAVLGGLALFAVGVVRALAARGLLSAPPTPPERS